MRLKLTVLCIILFISLCYVTLDIPLAEAALVNTSTSSSKSYIMSGYARGIWFANGYHYSIYNDGSIVRIYRSADGETWSFVINLVGSYNNPVWDVAVDSLDDNDVHIVYCDVYDNASLYYRKGACSSSGSISWYAGAQTVDTPPDNTYFFHPCVEVNSTGYPWVAFSVYRDPANRHHNASVSSTKDGTWTLETEYHLWNTSAFDGCIGLQAMDGGRMYAFLGNNTQQMRGKIFSGGWGGQKTWGGTLGGAGNDRNLWSHVADGDDIYIVELIDNGAFNSLTMYKYVLGSGWGDAGNAVANLGGSNATRPALSIDTQYKDLYLFYLNTTYNHIYYVKYDYGTSTWEDRVDWLAVTNTFTYDAYLISSSYQQGNFRINVLYCTNTSSPYEVRVDQFDYADYEYIFYGTFWESTGDPEAPSQRQVEVTAYYEGNVTESFNVNGTNDGSAYYYAAEYQPLYFEYDLPDPRQYWISSDEVELSLYIFNGTFTIYSIEFKDLAGVLDDYPMILAKRLINGSYMTVEKRQVDKEDKVIMALENEVKYQIHIEDGTSYSFGDVVFTGTTDYTSIELTLKPLDFPQDVILTYRYVRAWAYRDYHDLGNENITVRYEDTKLDTNWCNITIYYYENHTAAYGPQNYTTNTVTMIWTAADNETDYLVVALIDHGTYGDDLTFRMPLARGYSTAPWGIDALGDLPYGIATSQLIPALILLIVMLTFSVLTAGVGGLITMAVASWMHYMGWITFDVNILVMAWVLAIIFAIIQARKRIVVR